MGNRIVRGLLVTTCALAVALAGAGAAKAWRGGDHQPHSLWSLYFAQLQQAKYVDLTHTITPSIPVWAGFGPSVFAPAKNPATGVPYTYAADGFEATAYQLQTDQLGTQLDPPAHWAPEYAAIDELPPTFAVRPLVVISIVDQVRRDFNYHLQVSDILRWERRYGRIPEGERRHGALRLVDALAGSGSRAADPVPGRLARRAAVPAPAAAHPVPRPRAAGHRLDADAGRRELADAQRLRTG